MNFKKNIKYFFEYGVKIFSITKNPYLNNFDKKHLVIKNYLQKELSPIINSFLNDTYKEKRLVKSDKNVWVLWWEGVEEMPEIVKHCIKSIKNNCKDYKVNILTKDNYFKYVSLPEHIVKSFNAGYFEIVHMADILRCFLLSEYGGIWLDATVFLSSNLPIEYTESLFYSRKTNNFSNKFASKGRWCGYFMATGYKNSLLFDFLRVAYTEYWRKHKIIIDYFLLDYLILIAYDNFDLVKEAIDAVKPNNLAIKDLVDNLNKPFDEIKWEEIKKDTCLYKLSWKMNVYDQVEGRKTFYYKIVKGEE